MLFFLRLLTAGALFVFLFIFLFIGSLAVGGAIAGVRSSPPATGSGDVQTSFQRGYESGQRAGAEFARKYRGTIFLTSLGGAGVGSVAIAFSGILPWCRKRTGPPPVPR